MLRFGVAVILLLLVGAPAALQSYAGQPVLVLGDSLSAGYGIPRAATGRRCSPRA